MISCQYRDAAEESVGCCSRDFPWRVASLLRNWWLE